MGDVINSATGAVKSLPAMIIQRSDPQLYDLLTNGILQGRLDFDRSLLGWLLSVLYDSSTHSYWNLAGMQNTQDDLIVNIVIGTMFLIRMKLVNLHQ